MQILDEEAVNNLWTTGTEKVVTTDRLNLVAGSVGAADGIVTFGRLKVILLPEELIQSIGIIQTLL